MLFISFPLIFHFVGNLILASHKDYRLRSIGDFNKILPNIGSALGLVFVLFHIYHMTINQAGLKLIYNYIPQLATNHGIMYLCALTILGLYFIYQFRNSISVFGLKVTSR